MGLFFSPFSGLGVASRGIYSLAAPAFKPIFSAVICKTATAPFKSWLQPASPDTVRRFFFDVSLTAPFAFVQTGKQTMAPYQITIRVRKSADLFVNSTEDNPMVPGWEADSGLQRVADFLKVRRLFRGVVVTVQYPDTIELPPDAPAQLDEAVERYCDARIAENGREMRFKIQTGLSGLAYSVIIAVVASFILEWLVAALNLSGYAEEALTGLYTVGAWAIVWGPLASIFYEWLPNNTAIRVYRTIKRGKFILQPVPMSEVPALF
jgi:hypothetical protein